MAWHLNIKLGLLLWVKVDFGQRNLTQQGLIGVPLYPILLLAEKEIALVTEVHLHVEDLSLDPSKFGYHIKKVRPSSIAVKDVEFNEFSERDESEAAIWIELYSSGRRIIYCCLRNLCELL